ncbi:MAG: N-acetylmuramoyl-L-alanine amidase family protein [Pararhodobacter sp.]
MQDRSRRDQPLHLTRRKAVGGMGALLALAPGMVRAQADARSGFSALARVSDAARLRGDGTRLLLDLPLSQPVPWRLRHMANPPRLVLDFRQVDWAGFSVQGRPPPQARDWRTGALGDGWTRLVLELTEPMLTSNAGMTVDPDTGRALLSLRMAPASAEALAARIAEEGGVRQPDTMGEGQARRPPLGARPTVVVLDPGHGGIDPGAVQGRLTEAALMLTFSRELAETLRRRDGFEVVTTRDDDSFVSLEGRLRLARQARADLFLSLHADSLPEGNAHGATVYTLAEEASDEASALLAERHDRADLLGGGVDLRQADDAIARVLMAIARTESQPRTDRMARALVDGISGAGLRMHSRPWQQADFTVLRAPDIPSALLEVGFMSSPRDLQRLQDAAWRGQMALALADSMEAWVAAEIAQADLRRR